MAMDDIDYTIHGAEMQFVEIELDPGEAAVGEAGSMMYMDSAIQMDTVFGDGRAQQGGFFGGEGFIMQKLEGEGMAFVHAGGTLVKRELAAGETLLIDTGCVVAYTPNARFEIQYVGKIKTALFGGEGLFFANMTGPGTIWLQSLPFSRLASRVFAAAPQRGGSSEEGSVLGGLAGGGLLGSIFSGGDDD